MTNPTSERLIESSKGSLNNQVFKECSKYRVRINWWNPPLMLLVFGSSSFAKGSKECQTEKAITNNKWLNMRFFSAEPLSILGHSLAKTERIFALPHPMLIICPIFHRLRMAYQRFISSKPSRLSCWPWNHAPKTEQKNQAVHWWLAVGCSRSWHNPPPIFVRMLYASYSHTIIWLSLMVNMGKYTSPMDAVGIGKGDFHCGFVGLLVLEVLTMVRGLSWCMIGICICRKYHTRTPSSSFDIKFWRM